MTREEAIKELKTRYLTMSQCMTEKPILFNTEMVESIIADRKTVTRRLIKPQPKTYADVFDIEAGDVVFWRNMLCKMKEPRGNRKYLGELDAVPMNPPYRSNDLLYVRETWAKIPGASSKGGYAFKYLASDEGRYWDKSYGFKWRPSIHMPKEAARIWLKVTNVGVQQIRDMTIDDVLHEGVSIEHGFKDFVKVWDSTIPQKEIEQYGWDANPWVWVITFERLPEYNAEIV